MSGLDRRTFTWRPDEDGCREREPVSGDYCLLDKDHGTWHGSAGRVWPREGTSPGEELNVLRAELRLQGRAS
jgi:hypothetical protein